MFSACPLYPRKGTSGLSREMSALCQKQTLPFSAPRRALGDDVNDLERHHYFAGLIDYLDEYVIAPRSGFDCEGTALSTVTRTDRVSPGRTGLTQRNSSPPGEPRLATLVR